MKPRPRSVTQHRSRILFIENCVPHPGLGMGFPRSYRILTELLGLGHFVTLYPLHYIDEARGVVHKDFPRDVEVMVGYGAERLARFLEERMNYYDTILVCRPPNMKVFIQSSSGLKKGIRIVYDTEAISADREVARMRLEGKDLPKETVERLITDEMALAHRADTVITVCEREKQVFVAHGIENVHIVGHSLLVHPTSTPFEERKHILFVGPVPNIPIEQSPNGESLLWFAENVLPRVREALGEDVQLLVAGINDAARTQSLNSKSVRILGYVDDLSDLYASSRIFVAPQRFAAGIPLKVYEAAAYGLPIVASLLISSQLEWQDGKDLLSVPDTDAAGFADACVRLYTRQDLWRKIRENGARLSAIQCSPKIFRESIATVFG